MFMAMKITKDTTTDLVSQNKRRMKIYNDVDQQIQNNIKTYLDHTGGTKLKSGDDFAIFMNMVRSGKYSDAFLKEVFYRLDWYINGDTSHIGQRKKEVGMSI